VINKPKLIRVWQESK